MAAKKKAQKAPVARTRVGEVALVMRVPKEAVAYIDAQAGDRPRTVFIREVLAKGDAVTAETRKGKQVVNLRKGATVAVVRLVAADDDTVAVVGENRKMLVFPLGELPEMARGQGVTLQRYRDGLLSDAVTLKLEDGLSWPLGGDSGRVRTEADLAPWRAARGAAGRMAPMGFPRSNRFGPAFG